MPTDSDIIAALQDWYVMRKRADVIEVVMLSYLRDIGWSWDELAERFEMTRPGLTRRYQQALKNAGLGPAGKKGGVEVAAEEE